jgi:S-adenosylmethionine:tRNA ribosyltransferase-isomerase
MSAAIDFSLPSELEAHEPAELRGTGRDDVRLLVTQRSDDSMTDAHFRDLPRFLRAGDLVVLNTTATLPAALTAIRANGDAIALHVSTPLPGGLVVVEPRLGTRPSRPLERRRPAAESETLSVPAGETPALPWQGERLVIPDGTVTLLTPYRDSQRLWIARFDGMTSSLHAYLQRYGRPITYSYIDRRFPIDAYQTVFASEPGSAEMPSAGRAFTRSMLACLRRSGVRLAKLVLHAGVASLENHERPYEEFYEVPARTAELVRQTKARGGRVVAVGTTVVRALESSVDAHGEVIASRGWTDLVITPERGIRVVDALLTGFHEPRASHLQMLEALAGRDHVAKAYDAALAKGYLWHEFGDLHLIL